MRRKYTYALKLAVLLVIGATLAPAFRVSAANPQVINFQGKVVNANGTNVTDGSYSFSFVMFDDATLGSESDGSRDKWHELNKTVQVTNGVFQTYLGSATALPDFNANPNLYLAVKFNGDVAGYMTPRIQMASVPYALNSDKVGGLGTGNLVQLGQGLQADGTNNSSISINKTSATGKLLDLQRASTSVFSVNNDGSVSVRNQTNGLTAFVIQNAAGTPDSLFVANTTNNQIKIGNDTATSGAETTMLVLDIATTANTPTGTNGGMFYDTNLGKFRCYQGGWTNCIAADTLQTAYDNSSSPATVLLADGKNFVINAADTTTDPSVIVNLQCATCSANGGRFAVQRSGTDVLNVGPSGSVNITPTSGQNVITSLSGGSQAQFNAGTAPTTDLVKIDNTGQPVTTAGVSGLQINYVGGAGAIEASGARIDLTPGSTASSTWNGLRIVANATGAAANVSQNGMKLEGPTTPGTGTDTGINIATGWDIGLAVNSGGIQLAAMDDPTTPTAGNLRIYAKSVSGRPMLKGIGPAGVDYTYQPSLFQQSVFLATPGNGISTSTYTTVGGGALTAVGTLNTAFAGSEALGYAGNVVTGAVSGNTAGISNSNLQYFRGSVANGASGWFYASRFYLPDLNTAYRTATGSRIFFGMTSIAMATMVGSDNPVADFAGLQFSGPRGDTTFRFAVKDNTTMAVTDTAVVQAQNKVYQFYMYVAPQGGKIIWRLDNLTDGTTPVECDISPAPACPIANLPRANIALRAGFQISTHQAQARNIRFQQLYVETDR
ncbi:MAG: hypothetical protein JWL85_215 [Candidatus Saccharibacteria bacterium]|nr:hypothetical protein [Candidatus Saccharibacteria bacterium]